MKFATRALTLLLSLTALTASAEIGARFDIEDAYIKAHLNYSLWSRVSPARLPLARRGSPDDLLSLYMSGQLENSSTFEHSMLSVGQGASGPEIKVRSKATFRNKNLVTCEFVVKLSEPEGAQQWLVEKPADAKCTSDYMRL